MRSNPLRLLESHTGEWLAQTKKDSVAWRRPLLSENCGRILPRWWSDKPIRSFLLRFPTLVTLLLLSVGDPLSIVLGSLIPEPQIIWLGLKTGSSKSFSSYWPASGKEKVRIADGSLFMLCSRERVCSLYFFWLVSRRVSTCSNSIFDNRKGISRKKK